MKSPNPNDLQAGDIVLYSGTRLWSRVIRAFSKSKWSHVGIVLRHDQTSEPWVVEALEGKGVRFVPFRCWLAWGGEIGHGRSNRNAGTNCLAISKLKLAAMWCETQVGKEYASPWQFVRSFGFVWSRLRKLFGVKLDTDSNRFFCSELVASALFWNGLEIPKHAAKMTPGDVAALPYWEVTE